MLGGCLACSSSPRPQAHPPAAHRDRAPVARAPAPPKWGFSAVEPSFSACFDQLRQRDGSASGRVTLEATIDESGAVSNVKAEGEAPLEPMLSCLAKALETTPFGPLARVATVRIPVFFTADGVVAVGPTMDGPDVPWLTSLDACVRCDPQPQPPQPPSQRTIANATAVVATMRDDFRQCYQQQLKRDRNARGSVWLLARVDAAGEVSRVVHYAQPPLLTTVSCLRRRVAAATFAPPTGGPSTVCIPITFIRQ